MSEAVHYPLIDRAPIGMFRASRAGTVSYANPALARLLGYAAPADLVGQTLPDLAPGADGTLVRWKTHDGHALALHLWCHASEGDGLEGSVLDASALDAANAQRDRTQSVLELVIRQMPAVWWIVDRDLRILSTGGAVRSLLGYAPELFIGTTLRAVHATEPGTTDPAPHHEQALLGDTVSYDTTYRGKHLTVTVVPHRATGGAIVGAIGTALDVTAARALERRMVDAQRAESLGVLAGGLAHDFNNLLVAVLGNADLALREVHRGAPGRAALENIRDAGLRAAELTDQLLAYSGRGGAGSKRVQPAQLVDELLRISAPAMPEQLHVAVEVDGGLFVRADPAQLRQVLLNLINNARDAIGERTGAITVSGRQVHHDGRAEPADIIPTPAGDYVLLEVSDDGPGMTGEVRRHVFEPFYTTKQTGHGLGLAAVLGIVRAHGGGIRLESAPGTGSRFQILWPTADPTIPPRASSPGRAVRTVLVVDDEELVRDVVARMIEDLGYATVSAGDGRSALAAVEAQPIDIAVVDLTMPGMNGTDVIAGLRARRPHLPIVVCSGFDRDGRGGANEADAYLRKPFRIDVLEKTLAKLLA